MWVVVDEAGGAAQEGRRHRAQSPRRPALTGGRPQACGGVGVVQRQACREVFKRLEGALGEGDGRGSAWRLATPRAAFSTGECGEASRGAWLPILPLDLEPQPRRRRWGKMSSRAAGIQGS